MALESYSLAMLPETLETILSDNGSEFRVSAFGELLLRYGITHGSLGAICGTY